jgi:hypothetical protein
VSGNITTGANGNGGNITGANLISSNTLITSGNANVGNLTVGSGTGGNITGANVISLVTLLASGNITGANITANTALQVGNASGGNITGANVISANTLLVTTANISGNTTTGNITVASNVSVAGNILTGGGNGGNITGANLITANSIVLAGNANVGNLTIGAGTGGNITGANVISATTFTMASVDNVYPIVRATVQNTTSGTNVDFTGIPSWAKRITLMLSGVSTSGTNNWLIQIGTSSGVESSGYLGVGAYLGATPSGTNYTTGFGLFITGATHVMHGTIVLTLLSATANTWTCSGSLGGTGAAAGYIYSTAGAKSLTGTLDRVRLTTVGGTDTFDAGSVNIMYE